LIGKAGKTWWETVVLTVISTTYRENRALELELELELIQPHMAQKRISTQDAITPHSKSN